jgi:putative transposase
MMQLEGFSITEVCQAARVSRAGFYRNYEEHAPRQADVDLRDAIQKIVLENRFYGYRRVTAALQQQDWAANHKRVSRLMRADNLLALRKRRYVLTTDSHHPFAIYPNLAPRLVVNGVNQLWVADITYIRLRETFLYLAVVLDAYSRKAVGWELGDTLEASLAVAALGRALAERALQPGMVHHSDRGVQYASQDYVTLLETHGFLISMSRTGNPYDNAKAESFMKTLKCEEVYLRNYRDRDEARASIAHFIEEVYNAKRLHSALGYLAPDTFEANTKKEENNKEKEAASRQLGV